MIPNEATRLYRACIAARKEHEAKNRKAKGSVAALRERQRPAGSSSVELQVLGTPDPEIVRARPIEQAARG